MKPSFVPLHPFAIFVTTNGEGGEEKIATFIFIPKFLLRVTIYNVMNFSGENQGEYNKTGMFHESESLSLNFIYDAGGGSQGLGT